MKKLFSLFITLFSLNVYAGDFRASGGISINDEEFYKWGMLEYQSKLFSIDQKVELGGWVDSNGGTNSSLFSFYMLGMGPEWEYAYIKTFVGIGAISNPDYRLGSYYQFSEEVVLGFKDERNVHFGLVYKHISNAGLKQPNAGRDMIGVRIDFPF